MSPRSEEFIQQARDRLSDAEAPSADRRNPPEDRDPWVAAGELRRIVSEAPADAGLLDDLADVRGAELDD